MKVGCLVNNFTHLDKRCANDKRFAHPTLAYAVWASASTALVAIIGMTFYAESASLFKITGITLIIIGVMLLNLAAK